MDQRSIAFEQLESVWPVHGSVLVQNGILYCVAGRSMFLDGGMRFWRLDPKSGRVLSETILDDRERETGKTLQDYVSWLNMPTALPDILSSDGRLIYMRSQPFNLNGTRPALKEIPRAESADRGAAPATQHAELKHLFSPTGFLDDSWWHRSYWMYGSTFIGGWCGYHLAGKVAPAGRILVFDDSRVYGFGRKPRFYRWTVPIEHHLFAAGKSNKTDVPDNKNVSKRKQKFMVRHHWTKNLPLFARAMVLADGTLFIAGPPDLIDEPQVFTQINDPKVKQSLIDQAAALDGEKGAILMAVLTADGKQLAQYDLDSPPVFDGMAAAQGCLFMSMTNGRVTCFRADK